MTGTTSYATSLRMAVDKPGPSYWEGSAPPSSVLGVGQKVPSSLFGIGSLLALGMREKRELVIVIVQKLIRSFILI